MESLPIPSMGTETQEPKARCIATSSVSNLVAETQEPTTHSVDETQEPTTHSVAETQEPATHQVVETQELATHLVAETQELATHSVAETQEPAIAVTQEPTIAVTQEPATAETQEPTVDIVTETQESYAQGAATLLLLHQEAETQESVVDHVATPKEPASAVVTTTQEPVTPQPEPKMASVLQENEFLRSELEAYKQEIAMAKEAYEKELKLYTLSHVATMIE
jgi:type IV secretory pathway TraG/TraD family ATPase VirD4